MARPKKQPQPDTPLVFDLTLSDSTLAGMVKRRASEAKAHWNKEYQLDNIRKANRELATGASENNKPRDARYQDVYNDNMIFKAKRTVLSFIAARVTQPEVTPGGQQDLARQFAADFEKVLVKVANDTNAKMKIKLAESDLLDGQRIGVLKWVYNDTKEKLELIYCPADSIVIGCRSGYLDEPDFVQHTQKRTIAKLLQQFPDKKDDIYRTYGITKGVPSQLEVEKEITENWIFVEDEDSVKLAVIFMANDVLLGKMSDPNWRDDGDNFIDEHMMPFVFFNFLNDGKGWLDDTSFIEQAAANQGQYNKRGATIAENAQYAGIGVPVFAGGAIKEETAGRVKFNPTQRIILDAEATNVNNAFTTWNAEQLQPFVFEDKNDLRQAILDTFGTNQVQGGSNTQTNTLGEAVLMRNQAEGRQQEMIDAVDNAMDRFYQVEAQMIYRYYDKPKNFSFLGDDGAFEMVTISQQKIAENIGAKITVKSGTNMPIDRAQRTAVALELMKAQRISTKRLYKELGIEDYEEAYNEFLREKIMPFMDMADADKAHDSREAQEDLELVLAGKPPIEREDLDDDYIQYLTDWLLTQKYEQLPQAKQQQVSAFVANIIAQAQRKGIKMQTQQPIIPNDEAKMPPVRPTSFAGIDRMEPDVKAQILQNMGYQPSALTPLEMQAGLVTAPIEKINEAPIAGGKEPQQPVKQ